MRFSPQGRSVNYSNSLWPMQRLIRCHRLLLGTCWNLVRPSFTADSMDVERLVFPLVAEQLVIVPKWRTRRLRARPRRAGRSWIEIVRRKGESKVAASQECVGRSRGISAEVASGGRQGRDARFGSLRSSGSRSWDMGLLSRFMYT
jgi:hypothetical protein